MLKAEKVLSFMSSAIASREHSKDPRTKVGAIILDPEYAIVASGWNGFPRNVIDNISKRYESPLKYKWMVHAEMNAIANAARRGVALNGCELLVENHVICAQCCGLAINSGIKAIYNAKFDKKNEAHIRLAEDYFIACDMMSEAGIFHTEY